MKICLMCQMPRPEGEPVCLICLNESFEPAGWALPEDFGLRLIGENRLDVAYAYLEDLVARDQESAEVTLRLAWLAYAFKDFRAVETWCHEATRLDEMWAEPHILLGYVLQRAGRWEEAVEEYGIAGRRPGLSDERRQRVSDLTSECKTNISEF
ncbi:hypothetical protein [Paludibaculum fermentans]|uniref:hypothetical protein n=1 Tax=Paludibaculum fermentans TaxID=1473598 RepID=UPI003EB932A2